ncbi:hypothetical protein GCM10009093_22660 [Brevundimonas terrae]|uniref:Uncharacterized protein n=1 Tax=Brevundimonas terrae TaxID=363631 RepID=A0ABP3IA53_9CAUL
MQQLDLGPLDQTQLQQAAFQFHFVFFVMAMCANLHDHATISTPRFTQPDDFGHCSLNLLAQSQHPFVFESDYHLLIRGVQ